MSSSDSSSEDENSQLLREAIDTEFINDSMFTSINSKQNNVTTKEIGNKLKNINDDIKNQPSLRANKNEDDQFNLLNVTPQFQNYIAKQLTRILDEQLNNTLDYNAQENANTTRKRKGGVRLLSDSKKFIKIKKSNVILNNKRKKVNTNSDSDNEKKCNEVAVNPEDILNKNDVKNWSTRSKAPVFRYKESNGVLTSIE